MIGCNTPVTRGQDQWPGTHSQQVKTCSKAVDQVGAVDTVLVESGAYNAWFTIGASSACNAPAANKMADPGNAIVVATRSNPCYVQVDDTLRQLASSAALSIVRARSILLDGNTLDDDASVGSMGRRVA